MFKWLKQLFKGDEDRIEIPWWMGTRSEGGELYCKICNGWTYTFLPENVMNFLKSHQHEQERRDLIQNTVHEEEIKTPNIYD